MIEVELKNKSISFSNNTVLDGVNYKLSFRFDLSDQSWYMSIDEALLGRKLVLGIDLLRNFHHLDVPPQQLTLISQEAGVNKPNYAQLNDTVKLVYG